DIDGQALATLTAEEFALAVGAVASKAGGKAEPLRLADCLHRLRGKIALGIELKDAGIEAAVLGAIRDEAWGPDQLVMTSFEPATLKTIRDLRADVQTGLLLDEAIDEARAAELSKIDVDILAPQHSKVQEAGLDRFAEDGTFIVPWTAND